MLSDMTSGECRRVSVERPDLHVYAHNPMQEITLPSGRKAWRRDPEAVRFCVVCPDEGLEYLPYAEWMTEGEAETLIARVLCGDPRPAKRKRGA